MEKQIKVKDIVSQYLLQNGFDGLCGKDRFGDPCGRSIHAEFMECPNGGDFEDCTPGYAHATKNCAFCEKDCDLKRGNFSDFKYLITGEKMPCKKEANNENNA
jgi:hypothetical protein